MHTADPEHRVPHLAFQPDQLSDVPFLPMGEVVTSYYLRMRVEDQPGVLADITRILADREISIDAMIQKEPSEGEEQTDIILLTHRRVEKQRRRRDREDRGAADGHAARSCASAWKSSTDALRLARAARGPTPRSRSRAILLEGLAPDGGLAVPQAYPRFTPAELAALRPLGYRELAFAVLSRFIDDIPAADLQAHRSTRTYTAATFGSDAITPLADARAGPAPAARVERPDARVQGHRAAAPRQPVRVRARAATGRTLNILGATSGDTGSSAEYAMRGKRGIDVFMLSPKGRMSPFQQAQMFSLADAQHPQPRDRGHVRRLPGHRQGGQRRRRVQGALRDRHRQLDQLGARRGAGRLLLQGLFRGDARRRRAGRLRRAVRQLRQHPRRARRARDGPADPPADPRHQRERRARRVLPHRPLPAARGRRDARDVEPVDGHLEGVELRALRLRRRRPRSRASCARCGRSSRATAASISPARRYWPRVAASGFVSGTQHARRPHRDDPRRSHARYGVVIDPHTADGVKVGLEHRDPAVPLVCIETALPAKFAATIREALGREPARPAAYADLEARPQHCTRCPPTPERVKAYIAAHAGRGLTRARPRNVPSRRLVHRSCATPSPRSPATSSRDCGSRCSCR